MQAYCASWRLRGRADLFYGTTSFPATLHRIGALSYQTSLLSQSQTPSLILSFSFWKQSHFGLDQVTRTLLGHVTQLLILRTSPVLSCFLYAVIAFIVFLPSPHSLCSLCICSAGQPAQYLILYSFYFYIALLVPVTATGCSRWLFKPGSAAGKFFFLSSE